MTTCALKPRDKRKMESCRGGGRDLKHKGVTRLKGQRATNQGDRTSVLKLEGQVSAFLGSPGEDAAQRCPGASRVTPSRGPAGLCRALTHRLGAEEWVLF